MTDRKHSASFRRFEPLEFLALRNPRKTLGRLANSDCFRRSLIGTDYNHPPHERTRYTKVVEIGRRRPEPQLHH